MSYELRERAQRSEQAPGANGAPRGGVRAAYAIEPVFADVFLDQLPDAGICQLGLDGEVQYWHRSAALLLGYDAAQMQGRPIASLYPEEERGQARTQQALFAASIHGRDQHSAALLARDGNRQPFLLDVRCIYDQNGDPAAFAVLMRNARVYTAPRHAPDALCAEHQLHLLNLADRLGDIAWLALDLHGRVVHLNGRAAQRLGESRECVTGRAFADFVATAGEHALIALLHRAVRHPEGVEVAGRLGSDIDIPQAAPLRFWLKPLLMPGDRLAGFSVLLLPEAGGPAGASEHAAAAQAIEKNWMNAAAHDLREPLRKVIAFSQLLQHAEAARMSDQGRAHLDAIQGAAGRMQALVVSLARLARIEGHHLYFENVVLAQVVEDVRADLQLLIDEHGVHIETGALPVVHGEAAQLREMFQNLIENSIRYRREGVPPRICISGDATADGSPHFIEYRDNASGIAADQIEHVFSPFRRGHSNPIGPGNGIGLTLCQHICWRHGGDIKIAETGPDGTLFTIQLGESHDRRREDHA